MSSSSEEGTPGLLDDFPRSDYKNQQQQQRSSSDAADTNNRVAVRQLDFKNNTSNVRKQETSSSSSSSSTEIYDEDDDALLLTDAKDGASSSSSSTEVYDVDADDDTVTEDLHIPGNNNNNNDPNQTVDLKLADFSYSSSPSDRHQNSGSDHLQLQSRCVLPTQPLNHNNNNNNNNNAPLSPKVLKPGNSITVAPSAAASDGSASLSPSQLLLASSASPHAGGPKNPASRRSISSSLDLLLASPQKTNKSFNNNNSTIMIDDDDDDGTTTLTNSKPNNSNNNDNSSSSWIVNDLLPHQQQQQQSSSSFGLTNNSNTGNVATSQAAVDQPSFLSNFPYESKPFPSGRFRWKTRQTRKKCQSLINDAFISRLVADHKMQEAFKPFMGKKFRRTVEDRLDDATNGDKNYDGTISPLLHLQDIPPVQAVNDPLAMAPSIGFHLRSYQIEGVNFLLRNFSRGIGSLLADDMGLGKSAQTAVFLHALHARVRLSGPHVIVCPLSTTSSWRRELERWAPSLELVNYKGNTSQRQGLQVPGPRVYIVTPATFSSDHKFFLSRLWGVVVVDEAHILKNDATSINKYTSKLTAVGKVGLTGTPVANSASELWALMNFLYPELRKGAGRPDDDDEDAKLEAARILKYIMLRRTKKDILKDLPPKIIHPTQFIDASHVQALVMERVFLKAPEIVAKRVLRCLVLNILKLNNHPLLFSLLALKHRGQQASGGGAGNNAINNYKSRSELKERRVRGELFIEENGFKLTPGLDLLLESGADIVNEHELITSSAKMVKLDEILMKLSQTVEQSRDPNDAQHAMNRVLIFSRFAVQLDILEAYCVMRGFNYERLDGNTLPAERELGMARFNHPNSKVAIFLITTTAGGVGVTLTGANHVIFYDTTYNPQVDRQAADRAHRIGQTRVVQIHRLCVAGSIEESILERAAKKAKMGDFVIDGIQDLDDDDESDDDASDDQTDGDGDSDEDLLLEPKSKNKSSSKKKNTNKKTNNNAASTAATENSNAPKNQLAALSAQEMKAVIAEAANKNRLYLQKQQQYQQLSQQSLSASSSRKEKQQETTTSHNDSNDNSNSNNGHHHKALRRDREEDQEEQSHPIIDSPNNNNNTAVINLTQQEAAKFDEEMATTLVTRITAAIVGSENDEDDETSTRVVYANASYSALVKPSDEVLSVCFNCKETAHAVRLLHCTSCVKSYHNRETCLGGFEVPGQTATHNWSCPRHRCHECGAKGANIITFNCIDCIQSYCIDCLPASYLDMSTGNGIDLPFVSSEYDDMEKEGMIEKRLMKYIRCPGCAHKKRVQDGESDEEAEEVDDDEDNADGEEVDED